MCVHLQNIEDLKTRSSTRIPVFDFEINKRSGSKELVVSEDCGVVSLLYLLLQMTQFRYEVVAYERVPEVRIPCSYLSVSSCDFIFNTGRHYKIVDGSGYSGGRIRTSSQHSTFLEPLGGCGKDGFLLMKSGYERLLTL